MKRSVCRLAMLFVVAFAAMGLLVGTSRSAEEKPTEKVIEKVTEPVTEKADVPVLRVVASEEADEGEDQKLDEKQIQELIRKMEEERKKELEELKADPAWKPSHEEVRVIRPCEDLQGEALHNFCLNRQGQILTGCGGERYEMKLDEKTQQYTMETVAGTAEIRIYTPEGKRVTAWTCDVTPQALCVAGDGTVFVGGQGRIGKLSPQGKLLASVETPPIIAKRKADEEKAAKEKEEAEKQAQAKAAQEQAKAETPEQEPPAKKKSGGVVSAIFKALGLGADEDAARPSAEEEAAMEAAMAAYRERMLREVTGIAATERDLFVCCPMSEGYGFAVWRFDHQLQNPVMIVKDLRGCCGQMDIQTDGERLWIPVNGEHKVKCYDRDGKELMKFGKRDRKKADGFGGCCEPKNLRIGKDGSIYAAESGPPVVVKRFDAEGKFLGVAGLPEFKVGCVRATVAVSDDGSEIYVLNTGDNAIHVLADKRQQPTHEQVSMIDLSAGEPPTTLNTFCLAADGRLLLACGGQRAAMTRSESGETEIKVVGHPAEIRVLTAEGKPLASWKLDFMPQAINAAPDGAVFVAGEGRVAKFDRRGKVVLVADSPHVKDLPPVPPLPDPAAKKPEDEAAAQQKQADIEKARAALTAAREKLLKAQAAIRAAKDDADALRDSQKQYEETLQAYVAESQKLRELTTPADVLAVQKRQAAIRAISISAMAVSDKDVFIACPMAKGFGFAVWRADHELRDGKLIVEGLRGCCGQMDIQSHGGDVYVAENSRKRVVRYDRDGKQLAAWGESSRGGVEGFGSCCNPMNLRFAASGELLTSEASLGRVKRYSTDGELLGLVGMAQVEGGCKNVAVSISPDGKYVYVMDIGKQRVCLLAAKEALRTAAR